MESKCFLFRHNLFCKVLLTEGRSAWDIRYPSSCDPKKRKESFFQKNGTNGEKNGENGDFSKRMERMDKEWRE